MKTKSALLREQSRLKVSMFALAILLLAGSASNSSGLLGHTPAEAAPGAADGRELCAVLESVRRVESSTPGNDSCFVNYVSPDAQRLKQAFSANLRRYPTLAEAQALRTVFDGYIKQRGLTGTSKYGDFGMEGPADVGYLVQFVRGCYEVSVTSRLSDDADGVRQIAAQIDQGIKGLTQCEGAPPPPPPSGAFAVSISCDVDNQQKRVACSAAVRNEPKVAVLNYAWTIDGVDQGEIGGGLVTGELPDGTHTIQVKARDTKSGQPTAATSTTVQVGIPKPTSGKVQVTTPNGTKQIQSGEKTQITLTPEQKAKLAILCEALRFFIDAWEAKYNRDLRGMLSLVSQSSRTDLITPSVDALVTVYFACAELFPGKSELMPAQVLAMSLRDRIAALPSARASSAVRVVIDLQKGPLQIETLDDRGSLEVNTPTVIVSSEGKNTVGVGYAPNAGASIVSAYQGTVSVQPKKPGSPPFVLQPGQTVRVTLNEVNTLIPPQPNTNVTNMTIQAAQRRVITGDLVLVPVWLINANNVANLNLQLNYDANVIRPEGTIAKGNLLDNALFTPNANQSGIIRAAFAQTSGIAGTGTVLNIPFRAIGKPGDRTPLDVSVTTINDPSGAVLKIDRIPGEILIFNKDGTFPPPPPGVRPPDIIELGDCDGDGRVTEVDALCALEMSTQVRPAKLIMDLDKSGDVTSRDAVLILQRAIGK